MTQAEGSQIDRLLGRAMAQRRLAIGISVDEVARHCRMSPATIARIEAGRARVEARVLYDIADLLDIPVTGLFRNFENNVHTHIEAPDIRVAAVTSHYNALSVPHRRAIFAFLVASGADRRDTLSNFA